MKSYPNDKKRRTMSALRLSQGDAIGLGTLFVLAGILAILFGLAFASNQYYSPSSNWAGYAPVSRSSATAVTGSFTVPERSCSRSWALGIWTGLGGLSPADPHVRGSSLDQTGLYVTCTAGRETVTPWYEQYPAAPATITGFLALPGQSVLASVRVRAGLVRFTLYNYTSNTLWSTSLPEATRSFKSAECVVEYVPRKKADADKPTAPHVVFPNCQAPESKFSPTSIYNIDTNQSPGDIRSLGGFSVSPASEGQSLPQG